MVINDHHQLPVAQILYWGEICQLDSQTAYPLLAVQYDPQHEQLRVISLIYAISVLISLPARDVDEAWFEVPQTIGGDKYYPFRVYLSGHGFRVAMYPKGTSQAKPYPKPLEEVEMGIGLATGTPFVLDFQMA